MRKIKLLLSKIFFISLILISNSFSKALPPGSGVADVPSNVLILLDKSGSMAVTTRTGANIGNAHSVTILPGTGDYLSHDGNKFIGVDHSGNVKKNIYGSNDTFQINNSSCSTQYQRGYGSVVHGDFLYFTGQHRWNRNATVCRLNLNTGATQQLYGNFHRNSRIRIVKHNNIIIAVEAYNAQVFLYNTTTGASRACSAKSKLREVLKRSIYDSRPRATIDANGNLVIADTYWARLFKFTRSGTNCPSNSATWETRNHLPLLSTFSIAAHPTDPNTFYYSTQRNVAKYTFYNSGVVNSSVTVTTGNYGGYPANYNPTSRSAVRINYAKDIEIDSTLNRVFVADTNNSSIQTFDLDLNWHDQSGYGPTLSRMQGAHEAIQSLVTDSSLTSSVNFGFAYWSHDAASTVYWYWWKLSSLWKPCSSYIGQGGLTASHWLVRYGYWCYMPNVGGTGYSGWDSANNQATPCDSSNCLKIRVDRNGAQNINSYIKQVQSGGGTDANTWAKIAEEYYGHKSDSPIDKDSSDCQGSYVIVIGDGDWYNQSSAETKVKNLLNKKKVKTFTVAYGGGISSTGIAAFDAIAQAGGTDRVIRADTTDQLKAQLNAAIRSVIADKLSFTAPAITATIEEGGSLFQAQFKYKQNQEWQGSLTRTAINSKGEIDEKDPDNWNAADVMPSSNARKIWGIIPGTDYKRGYNNYVEANSALIAPQLEIFGNKVGDYHRDTARTAGVVGNTRCSTKGDSRSTIADGTADDVKGLISFSRGQDYFDYDGDCILNEDRRGEPTLDANGNIIAKGKKAYLGDIFHSEMVVVGAPSADTAFTSKNQEAYWRSINNYDAWAKSLSNRPERIYVGGNDGMIHSFDSKTGVEKWAFIPPYVMGKIPLMVNENLNNNKAKVKGGSNAMYGVDGSPVVHDMFFKSPLGAGKKWHTILMVPFGRGGNGFTVLDVTKPNRPLHLYSVYNDHIRNKVYVTNHLGTQSEYEYIDDTYSVKDMEESIEVQDNYNNNNNIDTECRSDTTTSCYSSRTWTFPVVGAKKEDLRVFINDKRVNVTVTTNATTGKTEFTLPQPNKNQPRSGEIFFQANGDETQEEDIMMIKLTRKASQNLSFNLPDAYNYKELGETWSAPRIFRLPNRGAGDNSILDDTYVAVMGGGYGGRNDGVGSALFVINLEDNVTPGKLEKVILIDDDPNLEIINAVPGTPVVVTADTARGIDYSGALVYTNDFEGKITKFNLTNMDKDVAGNPISIYDQSTLLNIEADTTNGRYQYHSMDAGIGKTSKNLWLFSGTGDYERLTYKDSKVDNIMYGFRDKFYPKFNSTKSSVTLLHGLQKCMDTTGDETGAKCPLTTKSVSLIARATKDSGWFIKLDSSQKISAEPTLSNGLVYFPIFEPSKSKNKCSLGLALICAVDDECGTNVSKQLNNNKSLKSQEVDGKTYAGRTCKAVGQGVLSRLVVFANKLFANIAGKSEQEKTDLVIIDTGEIDIDSFRNSWRDANF